jgi:hypothetical protein
VVAVLHELVVAVVEAAVVEAGDDVVAEADVVAVVEFDAVGFDFACSDAVEPSPGVQPRDGGVVRRDQETGSAVVGVGEPGLVGGVFHLL